MHADGPGCGTVFKFGDVALQCSKCCIPLHKDKCSSQRTARDFRLSPSFGKGNFCNDCKYYLPRWKSNQAEEVYNPLILTSWAGLYNLVYTTSDNPEECLQVGFVFYVPLLLQLTFL